MNTKVAERLASLGPLGYLPAPGTVATLITLPAVYLLAGYFSPIGYARIACLVAFIAWCAIHVATKHSSDSDPSHIVIDEVVGCLYTFLFLPINGKTLILGCLFFRFFDITKWCGVRYCEKLSGAWGVLLDDCAAGLLSNVALQWMIHFGFM